MTTPSNSPNTNAPAIPSDHEADNCVLIGWNTSVPWDNPRNLLSVETATVIEKVVTAVLFPVLYLIGAPANIVNLVVFYRQGLRERTSLCLFCLALVDLIYLTFTLILFADGFHTPFTTERLGVIHVYITNNNITGLTGARYASMVMSVIVSVERCVSVWLPSTSQRRTPTKILAAIIVVSTTVVGSVRFVVTAMYRAVCFYELRTRRKSWQLTASEYYFQNQEMLNVLDGIFYGLCVAVGCPGIVLVTIIITAVKLQRALRQSDRTSFFLSDKEISSTKMVIWLSLKFFVLSIPFIIQRISPIVDPRLSAVGQYLNTYTTVVSVAHLSSYLSSSVNGFVYYFTSSRYRETSHLLLGWKCSSR